jgi:selenium metabolism protein YedF
MAKKTVDARGLTCPQPVILTRNALKACDELVTIVDNETAQRNVLRMAERVGCVVEVENRDEGICLVITKGERTETPAPSEATEGAASPATGPQVLVVSSEFMGRGEDKELGHVLMRAFFHTLGEVEPQPETIVFFNSGVKLVTEGSAVLEDLQALEQDGIEILACGTCLGQYELIEQVRVGEVSNMYTIAETLLGAGKTVTL